MKNNNIPEILFEKYLLNELNPSQQKEFDKVLKSDSTVHEHIDELKKSNTEILEKYKPEMFVNIIENRLKIQKTSEKQKIHTKMNYKIKIIIPAFSTLLFMGIFFYFNNFYQNIDTPDNTRIKGTESEAKLNIYKKTAGENLMLKTEDSVRANDLIQVQYFVSGKKYGAIFSIDGNGNITKHFPYSEKTEDTMLHPNKNTYLQNSYQLDNAPSFEIFYFIFSDTPVDIKYISNTLKSYVANEKNIEKSELKFDRKYGVVMFPLKKR